MSKFYALITVIEIRGLLCVHDVRAAKDNIWPASSSSSMLLCLTVRHCELRIYSRTVFILLALHSQRATTTVTTKEKGLFSKRFNHSR